MNPLPRFAFSTDGIFSVPMLTRLEQGRVSHIDGLAQRSVRGWLVDLRRFSVSWVPAEGLFLTLSEEGRPCAEAELPRHSNFQCAFNISILAQAPELKYRVCNKERSSNEGSTYTYTGVED